MTRILRIVSAAVVAGGAGLESLAWAQAPAPSPADNSGMATALAVGLIALFLAAVIAAVKLFDRRRRRADDDLALEAHVSDALMADPELAALPIAAHVARSGWSATAPTVVTVTGHAPSPARREAALAIVRREVFRARPEATIEPHIDLAA